VSMAKIAMYREEAHIGGNSHWERGSLDRRDSKKGSVLGQRCVTPSCTSGYLPIVPDYRAMYQCRSDILD
jgi:hypothetical protein